MIKNEMIKLVPKGACIEQRFTVHLDMLNKNFNFLNRLFLYNQYSFLIKLLINKHKLNINFTKGSLTLKKI